MQFFIACQVFAIKSCYNKKYYKEFLEMELKNLRLKKEITQEKIAKDLGISRQVYANYENGINDPSIDMLSKLANYFSCSIDYLVGREDDFGNISLKVPTQKNYSEKTLKLIECFEKLSPRMQDTFLDYIQSITEDIDTIYQEKKTKK